MLRPEDFEVEMLDVPPAGVRLYADWSSVTDTDNAIPYTHPGGSRQHGVYYKTGVKQKRAANVRFAQTATVEERVQVMREVVKLCEMRRELA